MIFRSKKCLIKKEKIDYNKWNKEEATYKLFLTTLNNCLSFNKKSLTNRQEI